VSWIDLLPPAALLAIGLSLIPAPDGAGRAGAAVPDDVLSGGDPDWRVPQAGAGRHVLIRMVAVEAAAVLVVTRSDRLIAGLDLPDPVCAHAAERVVPGGGEGGNVARHQTVRALPSRADTTRDDRIPARSAPPGCASR
jgi:hypothetical protein